MPSVDWIQLFPANNPLGHGAQTYGLSYKDQVTFPAYQTADDWTWSGTDWVHHTNANYPAQSTPNWPGFPPDFISCANPVWDTARHNFMLMGTATAAVSGHYASETWAWDGSNWTKSATSETSPKPRQFPCLGMDEGNSEVVMFGGGVQVNPGEGFPVAGGDETWLWDDVAWTQVFPAHIPPKIGIGGGRMMAYDRNNGNLLLYVIRGDLSPQQQLWIWDGTDWTYTGELPALSGTEAVYWISYDPRLMVVLAMSYDGSDPATLKQWQWDGAAWTAFTTAHTPPAANLSGNEGNFVVFDDAHDYTIGLFGSETWILYQPTTISASIKAKFGR